MEAMFGLVTGFGIDLTRQLIWQMICVVSSLNGSSHDIELMQLLVYKWLNIW